MDKEFAQKVFDECPVRFTRSEKNRLLLMLREKFREMGYDSSALRTLKHKGVGRSHNFVVGRADAPYIFTAHYDTPGKTGFLLFASRFAGQTWANIVYILLMVAVFALMGFGVKSLTDFFIDKFASSAPFYITLLAYLAEIAVVMLLVFVPMFVKNKTNKNDNTSGVLGLVAIAEAISKEPQMKDKCCFVFFDNEEWGLLGSAKYSAWLKSGGYDVARSLLVNLDCIGVGDKLVAASTNRKNMASKFLKQEFAERDVKLIRKKSMMIYMSDHASFKGAVMLTRMKRAVLGPLYIPNIHTKKDTECDLDLVETLGYQLADIVVCAEKDKKERAAQTGE